MDSFQEEFQELIELKYLMDAYKVYVEEKKKIPEEEIFLSEEMKDTINRVVNEEKGFLLKNSIEEENDSEENLIIDAADLFSLFDNLKDLGYKVEFLFSKNMNEMYIKVKKVKEPSQIKDDAEKFW